MSTASARLDPLIDKFDTQEEADSYDKWFRAMVQQALDDPRPSIPHDQAMAILNARLEARRKARAGA